MKSSLIPALLLILIASCNDRNPEREDSKEDPAEWFFMQRSYPDRTFDLKAYEKAMRTATSSSLRSSSSSWNTAWTLEGPANTGGRINCIAVDPGDPDIIYAGSASGGIFKTTDGGMNWASIFDQQPWISVSSIVLDPQNPSVIYAGTGDKNISITPFIGDGIYKSTDAGATWTHLGLSDQYIIAKIVIDPLNSSNIYAAAMGLPFERNSDRGVYKSTDGGVTWSQSLYINDSTGAIDLLINPDDPQILYAATWNRIRNNHETLVSGPDAGIYKSDDGGLTWTLLTSGLPSGNMSRTGLTMSGTNPDHLWAIYINDGLELHGIFRSVDGGSTWTQTGDPGPVMGGFGWYFGRIEVNPANENELWVCGVELWKTTDGGSTWSAVSFNTHADNHDLAYISPSHWILATDGGIYKTNDGGNSWTDIDMIPNNQFYRITWNPHVSGMYAGGVQDNGTNTGNASLINNWQQIFGADGFQIRYHPSDPDVHYVEIQNGEIFATDDGGFTYLPATNGIDATDRRGWDMPYILNPLNPDELYTGTYRVYANYTGTNASWVPLSPDLTDGVIFGERFHTISAIAQSEVNSNYLMAGTSDGNVWNSTDGGASWNNIGTSLPDRFVTSLHYSPNNAQTAYVTHSGYKDNDFIPHIHRTTDNGITWTDISGNLPALAINDMQTINGSDSILFAGTDAGVYGSADAGSTWYKLGNNMPAVAVFDLDHDEVNNKLLAGTFGRSLWSFPLDSLATGIADGGTNSAVTAYPNPAYDILNIESTHANGDFTAVLYNNTGEEVMNLKSGKNNVAFLESGLYYILITEGNNSVIKKIIKLNQ